MARVIAAVLLLSASLGARADFIGLYAGVGSWRSDFSGDVIDGVSLASDLAVAGDASNHFYVAFEHPIPLLPNVRLERTGIKDSGTGSISRSFDFAGQTFTASQTVATNIDLTHTDVTLYYEVVDIGMDLDIGLTARILQGEVTVDNAREDVSGGLPMLYARAKFGLPFTGTYLGGNINTISYSGNQLTDYALKIGWETENFILPEFGIEGGYRRWALDVDADDVDVNVDMDIDGFFINLTAHF
ncbi:MAG: TIGR04219 family outer membrane beta-barrel protein [Pseudomonadota bacterium]